MTAIQSKELRKKVKKYIDHVDDKMVRVVYAMLEATENDTEDETPENEEKLWKDFSVQNFLKGYGPDEPEYSLADIKEPNAAYSLKKLLLKGPVYTDEQIKTIEATHKSINEWRQK